MTRRKRIESIDEIARVQRVFMSKFWKPVRGCALCGGKVSLLFGEPDIVHGRHLVILGAACHCNRCGFVLGKELRVDSKNMLVDFTEQVNALIFSFYGRDSLHLFDLPYRLCVELYVAGNRMRCRSLKGIQRGAAMLHFRDFVKSVECPFCHAKGAQILSRKGSMIDLYGALAKSADYWLFFACDACKVGTDAECAGAHTLKEAKSLLVQAMLYVRGLSVTARIRETSFPDLLASLDESPSTETPLSDSVDSMPWDKRWGRQVFKIGSIA